MSGMRWTEDQYQEHMRRRQLAVPDRRTERPQEREFDATAALMPLADEKPASGPKFKSKAEARYADILDNQKRRNIIRDWSYEGVTLKLADGVRYTPDFLVTENDGRMTLIEIKGHMREAARVRLKVAVDRYPGFGWYLIWAKKGKFDPQRLA